ncbi:MAG: O-antigen ligase family protein [Pyrinomonadaceae bacterium]|nr:O-antigen ligase family protein [Pyrinomonadaceae bacterium]
MKKENSVSELHPTPYALHPFVRWLDRAIIFWLFVLAAAAPHSIAATQIAWLCGMLVWGVRLIVKPRFFRTPIDYALLCFILLTIISAFTSYAPDISTGKLRAVSLFTIVYLVAQNVNSRRVLRLLALVLIASCVVNVFYTMAERAVGRGVKIVGVAASSPLAAAIFRRADNKITAPTAIQSGDTVLEVDGRKVSSPEELVAALDKMDADSTPARVRIYRAEWMPVLEVPRGKLLDGQTPLERLGIGGWSRGRDWRASGFFGHYVTYAEALQLIASLAFGIFIALPFKRSLKGALLLAAVALFGFALLLTVTRASQLGLLISAGVIVLVGLKSRRTMLLMAACALPLVLVGLLVLQQKRQVGFFDRSDGSVSWRETVWREGFQLLTSKPRHLLTGVGMDSIKRYGCEWELFDKCRLPVGHMHSTPLQLALERGLPALLAWLALIFLYGRMLWRLARVDFADGWIERGLALGALGGLAGFFASGLVHYNFGDSEVVMIFYLIMGLCLALERQIRVE